MPFSKRQGNDAVCYTKPLDSLKSWNDHFFWVNAFAYPASFLWNTSKSVSKDPFPKSSEFNAEHYATLAAYPAPFHKFAVQRLLAGAVQNTEVRGEPIPTLPFVTSSISATPEHEDEAHTAFATGLNLRTIGAPPRSRFIPLMTVATNGTSQLNPDYNVKEKKMSLLFLVVILLVVGLITTVGGFSDLTGSDFIVGGVCTVISPDTDLQKVYVPQWSITNGSRLDDGRTCHEMVDEFAPPKFFASIRGIEPNHLFTEFNVGLLAKCLSVLR
ncbi:hypothetical protein Tco_1518906 [Tanacetum coccineum]